MKKGEGLSVKASPPMILQLNPDVCYHHCFHQNLEHSIRWASVKKINHIPAKNMTDIHLVDKWPLKILLETFKVCVAILKAFLLGYLFFNVLWLFSSSHFLFSRDHAPFWQTLPCLKPFACIPFAFKNLWGGWEQMNALPFSSTHLKTFNKEGQYHLSPCCR